MNSVFGIPAHPLLVHVPAVLLPLAAAGVVVMLIKKAWFERYKWAVLAITGLGALGAVLAAGSGEALEEVGEGEARRAIEEHAEAGEAARLFGVLFFVVVLAAVLIPIVRERRAKGGVAKVAPTWLRPVMVSLLLVSAGASLVTVIDAGHSGAKSVWTDDDGGGEGDDDD